MPPLLAQLYALIHRGNPGDVAFYRRICAGTSRILELGAGNGRVAIPLARAGSEVVALDVDPEMLLLAEAALESEPAEVRGRLSFVVANMTSFALERPFDRVIIPYNGLFCLLEPREVLACLQRAREHLAPGGLLALDVYRVDSGSNEARRATEEDDEPLVAIEHDGRIYRVYEESRWQSEPQRLDARYRFVPEQEGEIVEQTICQRYLEASELEALVREAGLGIVQRAGGFRGEPLDDEAEQLVLVAEA
jgi:SAM-dependent methyltransferase